MNYRISFQERAKLAMERLSKQSSTTLLEAQQQAHWLSQQSNSKLEKKTKS